MSDWLHNLPVLWMALAIAGGTYLVTALIYAIVKAVANGERAVAFKIVSPSMLPPLGVLFGLFVAATAAQVWSDGDRARSAVSREATALSAVVFLSASFPGEPEAKMRALVHAYIDQAVTQEWPEMTRQAAALPITPQALADVLEFIVSLTPSNRGQETAQRGIVDALESALNARQERIIISRSYVNLLMWACLAVQAICMLIAIAIVHIDNWRAAATSLGLFATGIAVSVLLILAHDRPFTGDISVRPDPLLKVMPKLEAGQK